MKTGERRRYQGVAFSLKRVYHEAREKCPRTHRDHLRTYRPLTSGPSESSTLGLKDRSGPRDGVGGEREMSLGDVRVPPTSTDVQGELVLGVVVIETLNGHDGTPEGLHSRTRHPGRPVGVTICLTDSRPPLRKPWSHSHLYNADVDYPSTSELLVTSFPPGL